MLVKMNRIIRAHQATRRYGVMNYQNSGIGYIGFIFCGIIGLTGLSWESIFGYRTYNFYKKRTSNLGTVKFIDIAKYGSKYIMAYAAAPVISGISTISIYYVTCMFLHLFTKNISKKIEKKYSMIVS